MPKFGWRRDNKTANLIEVSLDDVMTLINEGELAYEDSLCDVALLCAQLADHFRDVGLKPKPSQQSIMQLNQMDQQSQLRLALMVAALREQGLLQAFQQWVKQRTDPLSDLQAWSDSLKNLTGQLLNQSGLRLEEFARHIVALYSGMILGESEKASKQRLQRLDYSQLLAQAETAKHSAEERMAYLQKLKEEQEQLLGRRGKW